MIRDHHKLVSRLDKAFFVLMSAAIIIAFTPLGNFAPAEFIVFLGLLAFACAGLRTYVERHGRRKKAEENQHAFRRWR